MLTRKHGCSSAEEGCTHRHLCLPGNMAALLQRKTAQAPELTRKHGCSSAEEGYTGTCAYQETWLFFCRGRLHRHLSLPGNMAALLQRKTAQAPVLTRKHGCSSAEEDCTGTCAYQESWLLFCRGRLHRHLCLSGIMAALLQRKATQAPVLIRNHGCSSAEEGYTGTCAYQETWLLFCRGRLHRHLCLPGIILNGFPAIGSEVHLVPCIVQCSLVATSMEAILQPSCNLLHLLYNE